MPGAAYSGPPFPTMSTDQLACVWEKNYNCCPQCFRMGCLAPSMLVFNAFVNFSNCSSMNSVAKQPNRWCLLVGRPAPGAFGFGQIFAGQFAYYIGTINSGGCAYMLGMTPCRNNACARLCGIEGTFRLACDEGFCPNASVRQNCDGRLNSQCWVQQMPGGAPCVPWVNQAVNFRFTCIAEAAVFAPYTWYVPSICELNCIYCNRTTVGPGSAASADCLTSCNAFGFNWYYSSTGSTAACRQGVASIWFGDGVRDFNISRTPFTYSRVILRIAV